MKQNHRSEWQAILLVAVILFGLVVLVGIVILFPAMVASVTARLGIKLILQRELMLGAFWFNLALLVMYVATRGIFHHFTELESADEDHAKIGKKSLFRLNPGVIILSIVCVTAALSVGLEVALKDQWSRIGYATDSVLAIAFGVLAERLSLVWIRFIDNSAEKVLQKQGINIHGDNSRSRMDELLKWLKNYDGS